MNIRFLGTACAPQGDNDYPSILINGRFLINTGFDALTTLKKINLDVLNIDHIILTCIKPERYIGLAGLLSYLNEFKDISALTILGPVGLPGLMTRLFEFLSLDFKKMPKLIILDKNSAYNLSNVVIKTGKEYSSKTDIPLLFTDTFDNKQLVIDLDKNNDYALLFKNADALIKNCENGIEAGKSLSAKAKIPVLFPTNTQETHATNSLLLSVKLPKRETEYILY